jgi:hypothetical protein
LIELDFAGKYVEIGWFWVYRLTGKDVDWSEALGDGR